MQQLLVLLFSKYQSQHETQGIEFHYGQFVREVTLIIFPLGDNPSMCHRLMGSAWKLYYRLTEDSDHATLYAFSRKLQIGTLQHSQSKKHRLSLWMLNKYKYVWAGICNKDWLATKQTDIHGYEWPVINTIEVIIHLRQFSFENGITKVVLDPETTIWLGSRGGVIISPQVKQ